MLYEYDGLFFASSLFEILSNPRSKLAFTDNLAIYTIDVSLTATERSIALLFFDCPDKGNCSKKDASICAKIFTAYSGSVHMCDR